MYAPTTANIWKRQQRQNANTVGFGFGEVKSSAPACSAAYSIDSTQWHSIASLILPKDAAPGVYSDRECPMCLQRHLSNIF